MAEFEARIHKQGDPRPGLSVHIQIEDQKMRIWAGPNRLGSWPLEDVSIERMTPLRFRMMLKEGDETIVTPNDPTEFATATNAYVDARTSHFGLFSRASRSGLADRIRSSR